MSYTGTTPKFDSVEGDNIKVDGNIISSTDENGNIELIPNGTGIVSVATKPVGDNSNAAASTAYADASSAVVQGNLEDAVDALEAEDLLFLKSDGSRVLTANLDLNGHKLLNVSTPTLSTDGVNKQYADSISAGVVTRPAVKAATTASLGGVYVNGVADDGVGATLNLGPLATLDIDGITSWAQFNGILVKNQTPSLQNGRYFVSQVGSETVDWILTRCTTCDQSDEMPASYMFVQFGTANAGKGFVALVGVSAGSDANNFEIGYDSISFTQFSGGSAYSAGDALQLTDTEFDVKVDGTTVVVNGSNQLAAGPSIATTTYVNNAVSSAVSASSLAPFIMTTTYKHYVIPAGAGDRKLNLGGVWQDTPFVLWDNSLNHFRFLQSGTYFLNFSFKGAVAINTASTQPMRGEVGLMLDADYIALSAATTFGSTTSNVQFFGWLQDRYILDRGDQAGYYDPFAIAASTLQATAFSASTIFNNTTRWSTPSQFMYRGTITVQNNSVLYLRARTYYTGTTGSAPASGNFPLGDASFEIRKLT